MMDGFRCRRGVAGVLPRLQEKHRWLAKEAHVFFLAGHWHRDVLQWIAQHRRRENSAARCVARIGAGAELPGRWAEMSDDVTHKKQFIEATVRGLQSSTATTNSFYVFDGTDQHWPLQLRDEGAVDLTTLPFTTEEAASYIRHQTQNTSHGNSMALPISSFGSPVKTLPDGGLRRHAALGELHSMYLPRHGADLLAVDLVGIAPLEETPEEHSFSEGDINTRNSVINALALGAHLLRPSGALLLRLPFSMKLHDKPVVNAIKQHMRWSFQVSAWEVDGDYLYCMGCRQVTEHPITSEPKTPFPGLFEKTVPRPKRWNPRKAKDHSYFAAVMPSFTDAPLVKEPLSRTIAEEAARAEKDEERADALFNVSVGMVERGVHHSKRDD